MKKLIILSLMSLVIPFTSFGWIASAPQGIPAGSEWQHEYTPVVKCVYAYGWMSSKIVWCNDLSGTNWYRNHMLGLAQQLLDNGFWYQFPQYQMYYNLLR